jgi:DNA-binding MarR family transcriptional regulator
MSKTAATRTALAGRVWRIMFGVLMQSAPHRTRSLGSRGLTPNDSRALFSLDRGEGRTMRSLADAWKCDPSNATWIVDRLESLGLAERQSVPHDRRVKLVLLTAKGMKTRTELMKEFYQPPPELAALDREDLEQLHRVLIKLTSDSTSVLQHQAVRTGAHG